MTISPIAIFKSPLTSKFGIPRQSGVVEQLRGTIIFSEDYRDPQALRGLEAFDYAWLIWGFSENEQARKHPTVRPPRLGGNERMGVFATRSPFRPNNLGLSSVKIEGINFDTPSITVLGADLMDGTPIYDIKPYVALSDAHPDARCGFVDANEWRPLDVFMPEEVETLLGDNADIVKALIAQDPRPHYHADPTRTYGMPFGGADIKFRIDGDRATVLSCTRHTPCDRHDQPI